MEELVKATKYVPLQLGHLLEKSAVVKYLKYDHFCLYKYNTLLNLTTAIVKSISLQDIQVRFTQVKIALNVHLPYYHQKSSIWALNMELFILCC